MSQWGDVAVRKELSREGVAGHLCASVEAVAEEKVHRVVVERVTLVTTAIW